MMLRVTENAERSFAIGIALEDRALAASVTRILAKSHRYPLTIFGREAVGEGEWTADGCDAVLTTPDALQRRAERSRDAGRLPPVILALSKDAISLNRGRLADADAFFVVEETLFLLPSIVALGAYGLSIMPHGCDGGTIDVSPRIDRLKQLSRRDMEVLAALGRGKSNRAIASQLGISLPMAKVHMRRIMDRLGFRNRTDAAVFAVVTLLGARASSNPLDSSMAKGV